MSDSLLGIKNGENCQITCFFASESLTLLFFKGQIAHGHSFQSEIPTLEFPHIGLEKPQKTVICITYKIDPPYCIQCIYMQYWLELVCIITEHRAIMWNIKLFLPPISPFLYVLLSFIHRLKEKIMGLNSG